MNKRKVVAVRKENKYTHQDHKMIGTFLRSGLLSLLTQVAIQDQMKVTDHLLINLIVVVAIQVTVDHIQAEATQGVVTLRVIQIAGTLKLTHPSFQIAKVTRKRKSYLI